MAEDLRQRYAEAIAAHLGLVNITLEQATSATGFQPSVLAAADAVMAVRDEEVARLRAALADYENVITWDTTCRDHARLLDECRRQEERAEQAEERLALACQALLKVGYFTEDQISADLAPRIIELFAKMRTRLNELEAALDSVMEET